MEILSIAFFWDIAIIVIAATLMSALLKILKQPSLLAYIAAGLLIGPLFLGSIDFSQIVFDLAPFGIDLVLKMPFQSIGIGAITPEIMLLSELGVAFLLFSVGVETSIGKLVKVGKPLFLGTIVQVLAVVGLTILFTMPNGFLSLEQAVFVGAILAFSSTMVVVKILADRREINTLVGRLMISILLIQDFLVILFLPMLANISLFKSPLFLVPVFGKSILLIVIAIIMNRIIFPPLFRRAVEEQELLFLSGIATAFFFIGLSFWLGMPIAIGAFIGGIALSTLPYNLEIIAKIRALRDFFVTIFFVTLGIQLSFNFGGIPVLFMAFVFAMIFLIKPIVLFIVTLLSGYGSKISMEVGLGLGQLSEFGFVLAGIGVVTIGSNGSPVLSSQLFSFLITAVAISMIVTPYITTSSSRIAKVVYKIVEKLPKTMRKKYFDRKIASLERLPSKRELSGHIIIVGGGTVGGGLAKALYKSKQVIVIDHDPEVVRAGISDEISYVYGTPENPSIWERTGLKHAKLLIFSIPNHKNALVMIREARKINKDIAIFATAHYFYETLDFYKNGADFVSMPYVIGSNIFLENISVFLETGKLYHLQNFRTEYLRYLEDKVIEEKRYKPRYINY